MTSPVLDLNLRDLAIAYNTFVLQADECVRIITAWYVAAHGRQPMRHDLHHLYWRLISERETWGTMRRAMQTTWPIAGEPDPGVPPNGSPPDPGAPSVPPRPPLASRVIRVTQDSDGAFAPRMYSYWSNAWVSGQIAHVFAGSRTSGGPQFFGVDLVTSFVVRHGPRKVAYSCETEGWSWDAEGWIYLIDGPRYRRVNPFTGEDRIVFDISEAHPGCDLWQAHSADDGQTHSATVRRIVPDGAYPNIGTLVFRQGRHDFFPAKGILDESQVTSDGQYIVIKEDDDNRIISLAGRETRTLLDGAGAVGHSDVGPSLLVGEDNIQGACVLWDLRYALVPERKRVLFSTWNMGYVSVRAGRCLWSNDTSLNLVDLQSGVVTHLRDHGGSSDYDGRVKANLSPCGRVATYMSQGVVNLLVLP